MNPAVTFQCPRCQGTAIRRSHRAGIIERLHSLAHRYPYRCHNCKARFFLAAKENQAPPPSERRMERVKSETLRRHRLILLFAASLALFLLFAWKFIFPPPAQNESGQNIRVEFVV
jgi:hypothetical protein